MTSDSPQSIATTVVRLSKVVEILLAEIGLSVNQFRLLSLVAEGAASSREISVRLVMKPPNVTTMTNMLIDRGLLLRETDREDKRRVLLSLTRDAEDLVLRADRESREVLHYLVEKAGASSELLSGLGAWFPVLETAATDLRERLTQSPDPP